MLLALSNLILVAQTNPIPQSLPFSEDFSDLVHSSTAWAEGFRGWRINNEAPGPEFTLSPAGGNRGLEAGAEASYTGNMVLNFDQKLGFKSTNGGNTFIVLSLNTLGFENIQFSYDIMTIRNTAGNNINGEDENWVQEVGLQYRIGTSGDFTNIPGTIYQNPEDQVQTSGTTGQAIQTINVTLPSVLENQAEVQLRWVKRELSGSGGASTRPSFAIDNVEASGSEINLNTFYYAGSGDLNDVQNWSTNENGIGGSQPANFTNDDVEYIITNTSSVSLTSDWTVSGANSLVTLGNASDEVSLTIQANLAALIQVENAATLRLENASIPTFVANEGSTLIFLGDASDVPYTNYHNLVFDNVNPQFDGNGALVISGDVSLEGNVTLPVARDANEYNFTFSGDFDQAINTNGNLFRSYEISVQKTAGSFDLNGNISTDSQLVLNFSGSSSFNDNGNTIFAGNSVNVDGLESAYNFTGTLVLADFEEGVVNGSGDGNNFNVRDSGSNDNAVAALNNVIVSAVNESGQFRFRDGTTNVFKIKGDFIIKSQVLGGIRFYNNEIELGGDFIIENGFQGTFVNDIRELRVNGETTTQIFDSHFVVNFDKVRILNDLQTLGDMFVTDSVAFVFGKIFSDLDAGVYLANNNGVRNASENYHFDGPLFLKVSTTDQTELSFPIGKDGVYRPASLTVEQTNTNDNWYYIEMFNEVNDFPIGEGVTDVSEVRQYFAGFFGVENPLVAATITLSYGEDDLVQDADKLRIAQLQEGSWVSVGGEGDGLPTGTISSDANLTDLGLFVLGSDENMSVNQVLFESVSLYPNPTRDAFSIEMPQALIGSDIQLFNLAGNLLLTTKASQQITTFDLQNFDAGLYLVKITNQRDTFTQKIIKR